MRIEVVDLLVCVDFVITFAVPSHTIEAVGSMYAQMLIFFSFVDYLVDLCEKVINIACGDGFAMNR